MEPQIKISPKMQDLCLKILDVLDNNEIHDINELSEKLNNPCALPLLSLATDYLYQFNLIFYNLDTIKPNTANLERKKEILENASLCVVHGIFDLFEKRTLKFPYNMPQNGHITIRELTAEEYFSAMEIYNYEMLSLFMSNHMENHYFNTHYLLKQFAYILDKENSKKRLHFYIAESNGHILSFINASNYGDDTVLLEHKLPCENHKIYNVNFLLTRPEFRRQGLATKLLTKAVDDIFYKDGAYALHYFPICIESEHVMKKAINPQNFLIHKINSWSYEEVKKYGTLRDFIITRQVQNEDFEQI